MEDNKKPGPRGDISDLKARLGLKKAGAAVPNTTPAQGQPAQPAAAPFAAAPSAGRQQQGGGGYVPPPFAQPEPEPAAPPDPRRDPFAQQQAANLAAFYGVGQQLPGTVDAAPGAQISPPKPWARIGVSAAAALVVFVLGHSCGRVYNSRVEFNETLDQAGQIRAEVDKLGKQLNTVADVLNASKETQKGAADFDMTDKLAALNLAKPDTYKIFHTNYAHFEDATVERLFTYYDRTIRLYDDIQRHAKRTAADKDAIANYSKTAGKGDKLFGVTLDLSGPIALSHFVELGQPVCPTAGDVSCAPAVLKGFTYRESSGGAWGQRPIKGKPNETVFPMQPSQMFKEIASGNPDVLAFNDYIRRVAGIKVLANELVAAQKELLTDLKKTTDRPRVFTF